ncbi:sensor histidine kinase [Eubacteriales bacterium OttesenSCG-928-A19]|nr:sensor histidine kinase [Eubacteriales bacterium OttesenSCG-928-A19]
MNVFKRMRVRKLLVGIVTIVISIVTLTTSGIVYYAVSREMIQNTTQYQQLLLSELNQRLSLQLHSIEQMSLSALRNIGIISYNSQQQNAYERRQSHQNLEYSLASITYSATIIHSIHIYVDPPVPASQLISVQFMNIEDLAVEAWFPLMENWEFTWIPEHTIMTNAGEQAVIGFARWVRNAGPYNGIMIFNIKVSEVKKLIASAGDGEERSRILFNPDNIMVTQMGSPVLDESAAFALIADDTTATGVSSLQGKEYLLVSDRDPSGWFLVEATPWETVTSGSRHLSRMILMIGLVGIVIAFVLMLFFADQFTKPLRRLARLMERYPSDESLRLPQGYSNEFGNLFSGYGDLIARNQELLESLRLQYDRQREAEMRALQAMINPHFLYNTLDQINWMAIDAGQEAISEALSMMGKMFRIGLAHRGESMITIGQELTHAEYYLKLQKMRWQDRLTYTLRVDAEIRQCLIPRLILQPFIENSILHGFHRRSSGDIRLTIRDVGGDIHIEIHDNGVGIPDDWRTRKRAAGGYGLQNVLRRIEVQAPPPYGVTITGVPDEGTTVLIRLARVDTPVED